MVPWDHGSRTLLTPELEVARSWIGPLQFAIAAAVSTRPTCILAGLGILALYADGIGKFGLFHMTDYVFFPASPATSVSPPSRRPERCGCGCRCCPGASPSV